MAADGDREDQFVELSDQFQMPKFSTDQTCKSYTNSPGVLDHGQFEAALGSCATLPAADEYLLLSCVFFALAGPLDVAQLLTELKTETQAVVK